MSATLTFPGHWTAPYIGFPWVEYGRGPDAFDCWGLMRLVYACELGIDVPCLAGAYADPAERAEVDRLRREDPRLSVWRDVPADELRPFDVLLFGGATLHVGVAIDRSRMLHIDRGRTSEVARLDRMRWRLASATIARHRDMEARAA
jgi:cell wall-associated NlpC family hydrolase